jgi:hypothetical protein
MLPSVVDSENPYSTNRIWPPEVLKAYQDMPKVNGKTICCYENLDEWRAWFQRTPRELWNPAIIAKCKYLKRLGRNP